MAEGVDGLLHDAPRPVGKPPSFPTTIEWVVEMTLAEAPGEATHWTRRAMAKAAGISHLSVQRIWAAHGLQPHRIKTFKLSTHPEVRRQATGSCRPQYRSARARAGAVS